MKKTLLSLALFAISSLSAFSQAVMDYTPTVVEKFGQMVWDSESDEMISQLYVRLQFPGDVWWIPSAATYATLLDADGNVCTNWKTTGWSGPSSDYSQALITVDGLNQYEDKDYTLVIPEGLYGDGDWYANRAQGPNTLAGRACEEFRIDFNIHQMLGCPREDKTVYDFIPTLVKSERVVITDKGTKIPEIQLTFTTDEKYYVNEASDWRHYVETPVVEGEEPGMDEEQPETVLEQIDDNTFMLHVRKIDFTSTGVFKACFYQALFGNELWAQEDYYEGRSNPTVKYEFLADGTTGVSSVVVDETGAKAPVYNINGVKMGNGKLPAGIYIKGGKKFSVK